MTLSACNSGSSNKAVSGGLANAGATAATRSDAIKIGLLSTLDGPFAVLGDSANIGAKIALIEAGGTLQGTGSRDGVTGAKVGGKTIDLFIESSDGTPDNATEAARRLVEKDGVNAFVGPLSGDEGLAIKNYIKGKPDVTMVNGSSGAQNLTLRDPVANVFRFSSDGAQWMAGLGKYAAGTLGYKNIATVAEDYSFPYDQVGGFLTEFCGAGGKAAKRIWVPLGTKDYASYVAQIPKNIDAVYVALGGSDAVNFIKQFDQFAGKNLPILGGSITVDPSILSGLGKRVDGTVSAGPVTALTSSAYTDYAAQVKKYFPKAPQPGLFDTLYYVEMKALLKGLDAAGGDVSGTQDKLRTALSSLSFDSPQGPVKLDSNRQAIANNYLFKVSGGKETLLQTVPNVDQTLGVDPATYVAQKPFDRTNPSC